MIYEIDTYGRWGRKVVKSSCSMFHILEPYFSHTDIIIRDHKNQIFNWNRDRERESDC